MLIVPVTICMALVVLSEISIPLQNSGSGYAFVVPALQ